MIWFIGDTLSAGSMLYLWMLGGRSRLVACVLMVLAGFDGAKDLPRFIGDGNMMAAYAELLWVLVGVVGAVELRSWRLARR